MVNLGNSHVTEIPIDEDMDNPEIEQPLFEEGVVAEVPFLQESFLGATDAEGRLLQR